MAPCGRLQSEPHRPVARGWQRYLEQQDGPGLTDELPEVVFSRMAIGPDELSNDEVRKLLKLPDLDWDVARHCEIRAAGLNLSLPVFVRAMSTGVDA